MATPLYSSRADVVLAAGGVSRLVQISDFDGDGEEDALLVDDALCEAEGVVNSYVRKRYEVPLAPVPEIIRRLTANLAVYILKSRRDAVCEKDAVEQEQRLEWLKGLAEGNIDPGVDITSPSSPTNKPSATARPSSKKVSRESLKGFA